MYLTKFLNRIAIFNRKNYLIDISYKTQFVSSIISVFITVFIFFYLGNFIDSKSISYSNAVDLSYFAFSIIGISAADFMLVMTAVSSNVVREYQQNGIFEEIIKSNINIVETLFLESMYPLIKSFIRFNIYIFFAYLFFGLGFLNFVSLFKIYLILLLAFFSVFGISIIGSSCIVILKKGNFVIAIHTALCGMIGGVLYPISYLPSLLQGLSNLLPLKHLISANRKMLIEESFNSSGIMFDLSLLVLLGFLYTFIGVILMKYAIIFSKKHNTLSTY